MTSTRARTGLYAYALLVTIVLIAPTLIVAAMSFTSSTLLQFPPDGFSLQWYSAFFEDREWTTSATTSVEVAAIAAILATVLGTAMALGLTRGDYRGKALLTGLVLSPLVVPLIVVAVGTNLMFSRWNISGSIAGLVLAHTCLAIPYVVINVMASLRVVDPRLELAARTLGATPTRAFMRVTLPLIAPAVAAGALFAFIASWDEVVVAIFLSSTDVRTLPVLMWSQLHASIEPTIAAVASMLSMITVIVLALVAFVGQRARLSLAGGARP